MPSSGLELYSFRTPSMSFYTSFFMGSTQAVSTSNR